MDVSFLGGPSPQRGVGVVAPFDFALDRELWRWVPDEVSLHLTRTPYVPVEVSLDLARLVSEHQTLREAVRALGAAEPEVIAYACTSGSFVGGIGGERAMSAAMRRRPRCPSLTTSGRAPRGPRGAGRATDRAGHALYAVGHRALEDYLAEAGIAVAGRAFLGLTRHIWKVPYREVVQMARQAVRRSADALFISCTNLPTYDAIPQLEAELRMPVLSANQVTMWSALRRMGAKPWARTRRCSTASDDGAMLEGLGELSEISDIPEARSPRSRRSRDLRDQRHPGIAEMERMEPVQQMQDIHRPSPASGHRLPGSSVPTEGWT